MRKKASAEDLENAIRNAGYTPLIKEKETGHVKFKVVGMHSPHCEGVITRTVNDLKGIKNIKATFGNATAVIDYDPKIISKKDIKKAIDKAGYEAIERGLEDTEKIAREMEIRTLRNKVIIGGILSVLALIFSFVPIIPNERINFFILFLLVTPVQFYIGAQFYRGFWNALKHKTSDMNTLIAIGTSAAYFYSVIVVFFPQLIQVGTKAVYFDTAAIIITLILLGRWLEARAKGSTSEAIKKLIGLQAKTAIVIRGKKRD